MRWQSRSAMLWIGGLVFAGFVFAGFRSADQTAWRLSAAPPADSGKSTFAIRGIVTDEQGQPVAGAVIETLPRSGQEKLQTSSKPDGKFTLRFPAAGHYGVTVLVTGPSGKRASLIGQYEYTTATRKLFRVRLKPWRISVATVLGADSRPVADATVHLLAQYQGIVETKTDDRGRARLKFPADAKVDWVLAFKDQVGFDYYENYKAFPVRDREPLPEQVALKLTGAVPVEVRVIDSGDRPLADIAVTPWTIKRPGKLSYANIGGLRLGKTDKQGVARFPWIPRDLEQGVTFMLRDRGWHCPQPPTYMPGAPDKTRLTSKLYKMATIRGKVTYADGSPAVGIRLQGEGRGATNFYFRGHTSTRDDGTYELPIYPDQNMILAITDDRFAAASATGFQLAEGKTRDGVDFKLSKGTLIHGVVTVGKDKQPAVDKTATLIQKTDDGGSLVRWAQTDRRGSYLFRVGPGRYTLTLPNTGFSKQETLIVKDEAEIVRNGHAERAARGQLKGLVVDGDMRPVEAAQLIGESIERVGHAGMKTRSNDDGRFSVERWNDEMLVYGYQDKRRLAGFQRITADDTVMQLQLAPAGSVHGSAVDKEGKPIANVRAQLLLQPSDAAAGGSIHYFTQTDAKGRYHFPAVAVGMKGNVHLYLDGQSQQSDEFAVNEAKRIELKPVTLAK